MANIFNSVSAKAPKRHKFKLNHQVKLTGEMGQLLPIMCEPVLPGDRFRIASNQLVRFAPLVAPIMTDIDVYTHFFFVPNRIIWKNWEIFITGSKNGKKLEEQQIPVPPRLTIPASYINQLPPQDQNLPDDLVFHIVQDGTLPDYLGFPTVNKSFTTKAGTFELDELPLRAYQRIYFDWYRDENLSDFDDFELIDNDANSTGDVGIGDNWKRSMLLMKLQRRAWKKDYFTSALPFAQKGDDVLIPSDFSYKGTNPIIPLNRTSISSAGGQLDFLNQRELQSGQTIKGSSNGFQENRLAPTRMYFGEGGGDIFINERNFNISAQDIYNKIEDGTINFDAGTIRELRRAMAAQRFLEREAVGGTRYVEQILSFFGVKSSDQRMQRSEFLGGSKQPVIISQILQTSESTANSPLGQPAGNAVSAGGKYVFDREFEEHGFIIGIMSVIPKAEYQNGYPRKYLKRDRFDYYWPQFARIGEQPILGKELYYDFVTSPTQTRNEETFGYTPRYAEYKFINSHVHGDFKDTLSFWTLARRFTTIPKLNESFITCKPSNEIYAYEDVDFSHLWIQVAFDISALRPIPKYNDSI